VSAFNVGGPLRGFAWARLGVAVVPLALGPFVSPGLVAGEREVLALALVVALASSGALLLFGPPAQPRRLAWFICLLDAVLITAVVAATGGARSIFAFLYVLCVTSACVLLSRTRGLAIAAVSSVLYTGIVVSRTVLPLIQFSDAPQETTALELVTMFLNAATLLVVAIVAVPSHPAGARDTAEGSPRSAGIQGSRLSVRRHRADRARSGAPGHRV